MYVRSLLWSERTPMDYIIWGSGGSHTARKDLISVNIKCVVLDIDNSFSVGFEAYAVSRVG